MTFAKEKLIWYNNEMEYTTALIDYVIRAGSYTQTLFS